MDAIDTLVKNLKRNAEKAKQAQIRFVECVSVDWQAKSMTACGTADGIEYLDILLGLNGTYMKPAVGSVCLIGIIDGLEVATFLISAEKVELIETLADEIVMNRGGNGGLVKVKELTERLNAIEEDLNALKTAFGNWTVIPEDGGAALKLTTAKWYADRLELTERGEIENRDIRH